MSRTPHLFRWPDVLRVIRGTESIECTKEEFESIMLCVRALTQKVREHIALCGSPPDVDDWPEIEPIVEDAIQETINLFFAILYRECDEFEFFYRIVTALRSCKAEPHYSNPLMWEDGGKFMDILTRIDQNLTALRESFAGYRAKTLQEDAARYDNLAFFVGKVYQYTCPKVEHDYPASKYNLPDEPVYNVVAQIRDSAIDLLGITQGIQKSLKSVPTRVQISPGTDIIEKE
jgi:hypothetical protein